MIRGAGSPNVSLKIALLRLAMEKARVGSAEIGQRPRDPNIDRIIALNDARARQRAEGKEP